MTVTIDDFLGWVADCTEDDIAAAVADYSIHNPPMLRTELQRDPAEECEYPLPDDYLFRIRFEGCELLPDYYIAAGKVVFSEKPACDAITLWYAAAHLPNANREYPLMGDDEAQIIVLKLRSIVAGKDDDGATEYKIGDVSIKGGARKLASSLQSQYEAAVARKIGSVGLRSRYTTVETAQL